MVDMVFKQYRRSDVLSPIQNGGCARNQRIGKTASRWLYFFCKTPRDSGLFLRPSDSHRGINGNIGESPSPQPRQSVLPGGRRFPALTQIDDDPVGAGQIISRAGFSRPLFQILHRVTEDDLDSIPGDRIDPQETWGSCCRDDPDKGRSAICSCFRTTRSHPHWRPPPMAGRLRWPDDANCSPPLAKLRRHSLASARVRQPPAGAG